MDSTTFRSLLYRYWFYGWLFRDVNRGSLLERAAAWRHNRASRRWLPVYLRRWTVLGLACYAAAVALEAFAPWPVQVVLYLPSVVSVPIVAVTLAAWVGLERLPAP